jgi:hypothetical protein
MVESDMGPWSYADLTAAFAGSYGEPREAAETTEVRNRTAQAEQENKERRFTNRRLFGSAVWRPPLLGANLCFLLLRNY